MSRLNSVRQPNSPLRAHDRRHHSVVLELRRLMHHPHHGPQAPSGRYRTYLILPSLFQEQDTNSSSTVVLLRRLQHHLLHPRLLFPRDQWSLPRVDGRPLRLRHQGVTRGRDRGSCAGDYRWREEDYISSMLRRARRYKRVIPLPVRPCNLNVSWFRSFGLSYPNSNKHLQKSQRHIETPGLVGRSSANAYQSLGGFWLSGRELLS